MRGSACEEGKGNGGNSLSSEAIASRLSRTTGLPALLGYLENVPTDGSGRRRERERVIARARYLNDMPFMHHFSVGRPSFRTADAMDGIQSLS